MMVIFFRVLDYRYYGINSLRKNRTREEWCPYEPRTISTVFLSMAYMFVFFQDFRLMRINKIFGPLQIALAKMFFDAFRFICMFGLILFAFALTLTQLYRDYGLLKEGKLCMVTQKNISVICKPAKFSNLGNSLIALFWSLFGYIEVSNDLHLNGTQPLIELFGYVVIATYHVTAIIILINMLIAMMAKSFEITSENEDTEWKFYRTMVWIRFLRREIVRPPPMNIIPNFRWFYNVLKSRAKKTRRDPETGSNSENTKEQKAKEIKLIMVERYINSKLL